MRFVRDLVLVQLWGGQGPTGPTSSQVDRDNGPVARDLGFEVAESVPVDGFVEVDFGYGDSSPLLCLGKRATVVVVDCGDYPVSRYVGVGAADDVDVVFAGAGGSEERIAAPDGPGDDFGAAFVQLASDLGEEAVVADHHTDFAEACVEDGVFVAGHDSALDFSAWECDFSVFADEFAVGSDEGSGVVDEVCVAFEESGDDVEVVFPGKGSEVFCGWAGDWFGALGIGSAAAVEGQGFGEDDQVGVLVGCLLDQRCELAAFFFRSLTLSRLVVDGGEAYLSWGQRFGFVEGDGGPFDASGGGPAIAKFEDGLGGFGWGAVGGGDSGPARVVGIAVGRELGLCRWEFAGLVGCGCGFVVEDLFAIGVLPEDTGDGDAAGEVDVVCFAKGVEAVGLAALDLEGFLPPADGARGRLALDNEAAGGVGAAFGEVGEVGADFVAGGFLGPALGRFG